MSTISQFRLTIGAKRQLTLPSELLEQLQVPERGELLVQVIGDHAIITPMVSVPRAQLPEDLRRTFESRRGPHASDIPLDQFLKEVGYDKPAQQGAAPSRLSMAERVDRLTKLTPNERAAFKQAGVDASRRSQPSRMEARHVEESGHLQSSHAQSGHAQSKQVQSGHAQSSPSGMARKTRAAARDKAASGS